MKELEPDTCPSISLVLGERIGIVWSCVAVGDRLHILSDAISRDVECRVIVTSSVCRVETLTAGELIITQNHGYFITGKRWVFGPFALPGDPRAVGRKRR